MDHLLQWITNFDYRLRDTAARARHRLQVMPVSEVGFYSSSLFELFESFPSLPLFFFRALLLPRSPLSCLLQDSRMVFAEGQRQAQAWARDSLPVFRLCFMHYKSQHV